MRFFLGVIGVCLLCIATPAHAICAPDIAHEGTIAKLLQPQTDSFNFWYAENLLENAGFSFDWASVVASEAQLNLHRKEVATQFRGFRPRGSERDRLLAVVLSLLKADLNWLTELSRKTSDKTSLNPLFTNALVKYVDLKTLTNRIPGVIVKWDGIIQLHLRLLTLYAENQGTRVEQVRQTSQEEASRAYAAIRILPDDATVLGKIARRYETECQGTRLMFSPGLYFREGNQGRLDMAELVSLHPPHSIFLSDKLNERVDSDRQTLVTRQEVRRFASPFSIDFARTAPSGEVKPGTSVSTFMVLSRLMTAQSPPPGRAEATPYRIAVSEAVFSINLFTTLATESFYVAPQILYQLDTNLLGLARATKLNTRKSVPHPNTENGVIVEAPRSPKPWVLFVGKLKKEEAYHASLAYSGLSILIPLRGARQQELAERLITEVRLPEARESEVSLPLMELTWLMVDSLKRNIEYAGEMNRLLLTRIKEGPEPLFRQWEDANVETIKQAFAEIDIPSVVRSTHRNLRDTPIPFPYAVKDDEFYVEPDLGAVEMTIPPFSIPLVSSASDRSPRVHTELTAMIAVKRWLTRNHWSWVDVSADNEGYDIMAENYDTHQRLYIEVKGRSREDYPLSLSGEELRFAKAHADNWALARVLTNGDNGGKIDVVFRPDLGGEGAASELERSYNAAALLESGYRLHLRPHVVP